METILILDDMPTVRQCFEFSLRPRYKVISIGRYEDAVKLLRDGEQIDLIVSDYNLTGNFTGQDLIAHIQKTRPNIPVIICTGEQSINGVPGASAFLHKPVATDALLIAVEKALQQREPY